MPGDLNFITIFIQLVNPLCYASMLCHPRRLVEHATVAMSPNCRPSLCCTVGLRTEKRRADIQINNHIFQILCPTNGDDYFFCCPISQKRKIRFANFFLYFVLCIVLCIGQLNCDIFTSIQSCVDELIGCFGKHPLNFVVLFQINNFCHHCRLI